MSPRKRKQIEGENAYLGMCFSKVRERAHGLWRSFSMSYNRNWVMDYNRGHYFFAMYSFWPNTRLKYVSFYVMLFASHLPSAFLAQEEIEMSPEPYLRLVLGTLSLFACLTPNALADNGTVVTGSVIGIDPINQIMRVYVTGVNGQALFGSPQTNYVDYLVSPNTVVIGQNNQFIHQSNVLVGSQIQMQFAGTYASTIVLLGNYGFGGYANSTNLNRGYGATYVQSYLPIQTQSFVHHNLPYQNSVLHNHHLVQLHHNVVHSHVGTNHVHHSMQHQR